MDRSAKNNDNSQFIGGFLSQQPNRKGGNLELCQMKSASFYGRALPPHDPESSNQGNGEINPHDSADGAPYHDRKYCKERMNLQFVPHYSR